MIQGTLNEVLGTIRELGKLDAVSMVYTFTTYAKTKDGFKPTSKVGKGETAKHVFNAYQRPLPDAAECTVWLFSKKLDKVLLTKYENLVLGGMAATYAIEKHESGLCSEKFTASHEDAVNTVSKVLKTLK
jgi:hypothetical protein